MSNDFTDDLEDFDDEEREAIQETTRRINNNEPLDELGDHDDLDSDEVFPIQTARQALRNDHLRQQNAKCRLAYSFIFGHSKGVLEGMPMQGQVIPDDGVDPKLLKHRNDALNSTYDWLNRFFCGDIEEAPIKEYLTWEEISDEKYVDED